MGRRNLGTIETKTALTATRYNGDDKLVTVMGIAGILNFDLFKKCLQQLFEETPTLKYTLHEAADTFYFEDNACFADIPILRLEINPLNAWREIVTDKIRQPFPKEVLKKYLWQVTVLAAPNNQHVIVFEYLHPITDGISSARLIDKLLDLYSHPDKLQTVNHAAKALPAIEELYPPQSNPLASSATANPVPFEQNCPLQQRAAHNFVLAYQVAPITEFSKQIGVKINAIITMCLILAWYKRQNKPEVLINTCVNLRSRITGTNLTADVFGAYFSCVANLIKHGDFCNLTFTEQVKSLEKAINEHISKYAQLPNTTSIEKVDALFGISQQTNNQHFVCNLDISNLGKLTMPRKYGHETNPIEAIFYYFFVNQVLAFSEATICFNTIEDTVYMSCTYVQPQHSKAWALQFIKEFINQMQFNIPRFNLITEWTDRDLVENSTPRICSFWRENPNPIRSLSDHKEKILPAKEAVTIHKTNLP